MVALNLPFMPDCPVDGPIAHEAFIQNLMQFPHNATRADREDLEALYQERNNPGLSLARISAIENCINEIQEDCRSRNR